MKLGLIAGNGRFPFLVLEAARAQGHEVTVVAAKEETFPELEHLADRLGCAVHWISLGQLGTCIKVLRSAGATHAVMAGQVKQFSNAELKAIASYIGSLPTEMATVPQGKFR